MRKALLPNHDLSCDVPGGFQALEMGAQADGLQPARSIAVWGQLVLGQRRGDTLRLGHGRSRPLVSGPRHGVQSGVDPFEDQGARSNCPSNRAHSKAAEALEALDAALAIVHDAHRTYRDGDAELRRLMNQAIFERIIVRVDGLQADQASIYGQIRRLARTSTPTGAKGPKRPRPPFFWGPWFERRTNGAPCGTRTRPTGLKVRGSTR
jgi:hypothetical protein